MDLEQFTILEGKILQAMNSITSLRQENQELKSRAAALEAQLAQEQAEAEKLRDKVRKVVAQNEDTTYYKEREAHIRSKVEGMLSKLEALHLPD